MHLVTVPGNPIPDGMVSGGLTTGDGVRLRYGVLASDRALRGTVCIFPGRADFIERYFETIADLRRRRFAAAVLDWRGQGGSERSLSNPYRGHVRGFRQYDLDLAAFMTGVVLPDCPPPYYAIGHSTGANVLLRALTAHTWFTRAVLSAPLIGLGPSILPGWFIRFLTRSAVMAGLSWAFVPGRGRRPMVGGDFPGNQLTSDKERYLRDCRTLEAAPQLGLGGPTFGWLNAAIASMRELNRLSGDRALRCPVLIVAAGEDKIVSSEAARAFAKRVPGVAAVTIERARHELLMERAEVREQFWAAFDAFIGLEEDAAAYASARSALAWS
jgi:lysophospholipase